MRGSFQLWTAQIPDVIPNRLIYETLSMYKRSQMSTGCVFKKVKMVTMMAWSKPCLFLMYIVMHKTKNSRDFDHNVMAAILILFNIPFRHPYKRWNLLNSLLQFHVSVIYAWKIINCDYCIWFEYLPILVTVC